MKTRVQKWGNSLAVRLPKVLANEARIAPNSPVDLTLEDGALRITPLPEEEYRLSSLLEGVSDENLHEEFDFGPTVGREAW